MSAPDCEGGGVQDHAVQDGGALPMHLCVYQNFDLFIKISISLSKGPHAGILDAVQRGLGLFACVP